MMKLVDGPAKGTYMCKRAPLYLRAVALVRRLRSLRPPIRGHHTPSREDTMSAPIERLRASHQPCEVPCFQHSWVGDRGHCVMGGGTWPCDTIAALDQLEAEIADMREQAHISMWRAAATLERAGFTIRGMETEMDRLNAAINTQEDSPTRDE